MQYRIYEEFFPTVEKKLKRIEKKCHKYDNPFTFQIIGEEIEERIDKESQCKSYYKFIIVEVEGTAKINNYECIAILEMHESGNIIHRINTEIELPERFKTTDNICEHCNSKRERKELYVIYNSDTKEYKQVGSSCLMLYTNGLDAQYVAAWIDGITELEENDGSIGKCGKSYLNVDDILRFSTELINKVGYFNTSSDIPTKLMISYMMDNRSLKDNVRELNYILRKNHFNVEFEKEDFFKPDTENIVSSIKEYYLSLEDNSEFIHNVQVLLKEGYTDLINIGYLSYLPEGYNKHIQKEVKRAKQQLIEEKSEYFGEINKRYKSENVYSMEVITSYSTMYGETYIYKITLKAGNILIWKSSNWYSADDLSRVEKITFTIKAHNEYREVKQTEVSRCKLTMKELLVGK